MKIRRTSLECVPVPLVAPGSVLDSSREAGTTGRLWLKRDDATCADYGGNKVRKLAYLLDDARALGKKRLLTLGAAGSHHVLATTLFGRRAGFAVDAVLVPQPRTDYASEVLRASLGLGLRAHPVRSWGAAPYALAKLAGPDAFVISVGGSNVSGCLGYVDAAFELADQIRRGEAVEPATVVVTLGSGGTVAGLAAGLTLAGIRATVIGVVISEPAWVAAPMTAALIAGVLRRLHATHAIVPALRSLRVTTKYLGGGYGVPLDSSSPRAPRAAREAVRIAATAPTPLPLDPSYTTKTFVAALDAAPQLPGPVLYWHTLSGRSVASLMSREDVTAPKEEDLAQDLRALLVSSSNGLAR